MLGRTRAGAGSGSGAAGAAVPAAAGNANRGRIWAAAPGEMRREPLPERAGRGSSSAKPGIGQREKPHEAQRKIQRRRIFGQTQNSGGKPTLGDLKGLARSWGAAPQASASKFKNPFKRASGRRASPEKQPLSMLLTVQDSRTALPATILYP